ncbi:hypothetical protein ACSQ67_025081 [Phaseolus vulgaris]
MGIMAVVLLSFLNTFFGCQSRPLTVRIRGREFSLNPGPINTKEHVLISILANVGFAFGSGSAYAIGIVDIIRVFYGRRITFLSSRLRS